MRLTEQAHHVFVFQNALNSRIQDVWFAQIETKHGILIVKYIVNVVYVIQMILSANQAI